MKPFEIPYAKASDGKPVTAEFYDREDKLTCYECGGKLKYKNEFERTGKSGKPHTVRAHFYHPSKSLCRGGGETLEHLIAKDIVANHASFDFYHQCFRCKKLCRVPIKEQGVTPHTSAEYRWKAEDGTLFIPDVAYLTKTKEIYAAVEIHHTNAMSDAKIKALNKKSIVWAEVKASHIIQRYNERNNRALVERSSTLRNGNPCSSCLDAIEQAEFDAEIERQLSNEREAEERKARLQEEEKERLRKLEYAKAEAARYRAEEERRILEKERKEKEKEAERIAREKLKQEEKESNEKAWNAYHDKKHEEEAARKRKVVIPTFNREEENERLWQEYLARDYEDRRKHLTDYEDMIIAARKKKKSSTNT
jgi:hypothetical protein